MVEYEHPEYPLSWKVVALLNASINFIASILSFLFIFALLAKEETRTNAYNIYVVFLLFPDAMLTLINGIHAVFIGGYDRQLPPGFLDTFLFSILSILSQIPTSTPLWLTKSNPGCQFTPKEKDPASGDFESIQRSDCCVWLCNSAGYMVCSTCAMVSLAYIRNTERSPSIIWVSGWWPIQPNSSDGYCFHHCSMSYFVCIVCGHSNVGKEIASKIWTNEGLVYVFHSDHCGFHRILHSEHNCVINNGKHR